MNCLKKKDVMNNKDDFKLSDEENMKKAPKFVGFILPPQVRVYGIDTPPRMRESAPSTTRTEQKCTLPIIKMNRLFAFASEQKVTVFLQCM